MLTVTGTEPASTEMVFHEGWNLVGLKVDAEVDIADVVPKKAKSAWKWENNNWSVWLPDAEMLEQYAAIKGFGVLEKVKGNEGFWVNAGENEIVDAGGEDEGDIVGEYILNNGALVAYWSFDSCNVTDDSRHGNDAIDIVGNIACVKGVEGNALKFDGQSYVKGLIQTLPMQSAEMTVCVLVKSEDKDSSEPNLAFSYGESINRTVYGIFEDAPPWIESNTWFTYTHCGDELCDIDSCLDVNGEWQLVCSTYVNGTIKNYVNGNKGYEEKVDINTTGEYFYIGTSPMEGFNFIGLVDLISVYNKELSKSEIKDLYDIIEDVISATTKDNATDTGSGSTDTEVEQPVELKIVGSVDTPDFAHSVTISGNYAYVADGTAGLQVIDISKFTSSD